MTNDHIALRLREHARRLTARGDNLYRIRAFRQAAMAVLGLREPLADVVARSGSAAVPGVGASVAETLETFIRTGEWVADDGGRATPKTTKDGTTTAVPSFGVVPASVA